MCLSLVGAAAELAPGGADPPAASQVRPSSTLYHPIRNLILVSLLLRVTLALITTWPDVYPFLLIAERTMAHSGSGYRSFNIYPPAWFAVTFVFLGPLVKFLGLSRLVELIPDSAYLLRWVPSLALTYVPSPLAGVAVRAPWIIADLLTAFLIYRIVRSLSDERQARTATKLWLLNPLVILSSSVLGQYDSIVALFTLLSIYLAMNGGFLGAGIAFGLGLAFKPTAWIIGLPLAGLILAFQRESVKIEPGRAGSPRGPLEMVVAGVKLVSGALVPLLALLPGNALLGVGSSFRTRLEFPILGGINLWLVELIPSDPLTTLWNWGHTHFVIVQAVNIIASLAAAGVITFAMLRGPLRAHPCVAYIAAAAALLIFLETTPYAQPHYFVVVFPFLIIGNTWGMIPRNAMTLLAVALAGNILSIWGPFFLWLPLAMHYPLLSARWLMDRTIAFMTSGGLINSELYRDLRLLFGLVAVGCIVWLIVVCMIRLLASKDWRQAGLIHAPRQDGVRGEVLP